MDLLHVADIAGMLIDDNNICNVLNIRVAHGNQKMKILNSPVGLWFIGIQILVENAKKNNRTCSYWYPALCRTKYGAPVQKRKKINS